jgi:hypothetical protein
MDETLHMNRCSIVNKNIILLVECMLQIMRDLNLLA